jgi:DNA-binding GntR family transcriptional regulator
MVFHAVTRTNSVLAGQLSSSTVDANEIDHASGVPPYRQLAAILRAQITAGTLTGRLPSEKALGQTFGLAQGTVRKALAILRDEGLIETAHGWGSRTLGPEERDG